MSWTAPGSAGEAHNGRPKGSARTWTFIPCRRCLPEWYGRSAAMRSMGGRVPSRMTNAVVRAVRAAVVMSGARVARTSMASVTYRYTVVVPTPNSAASWAWGVAAP
jgi:hypothetical protein